MYKAILYLYVYAGSLSSRHRFPTDQMNTYPSMSGESVSEVTYSRSSSSSVRFSAFLAAHSGLKAIDDQEQRCCLTSTPHAKPLPIATSGSLQSTGMFIYVPRQGGK